MFITYSNFIHLIKIQIKTCIIIDDITIEVLKMQTKHDKVCSFELMEAVTKSIASKKNLQVSLNMHIFSWVKYQQIFLSFG